MKCKKCNKELFQNQNGKIKLRTNILIFEKSEENKLEYSEAIVKCQYCKDTNKVPIVLNTEQAKLKHIIFE